MNRKIIIALTLMMIFLAACKATPDEAAVAQKTDYRSYTFAEAETLSSPESFKDSFSSENGYVNVNVNAQVNANLQKPFPAAKVSFASYSEIDLQKAVDVLFDGADALKPADEYSKKEIENMILAKKKRIFECQQNINNGNYGADMGYAVPDDMEYFKQVMSERIEILNDEIQELQKQAESAPESLDKQPIEIKFDEDDGKFFTAEADMGNDVRAEITITQADAENAASELRFRNTNGHTYCQDAEIQDEAKYDDLKIDAETAIQIAEDALGKMGINDMTLSSVKIAYLTESMESAVLKDDYHAYALHYTKKIGEQRETYEVTGIAIEDEDIYAALPDYERLTVLVDDNTGIIQMDYINKSNIEIAYGSFYNPISFEKAYESFKKQVLIEYSSYYDKDSADKAESIVLNINRIEIGYARLINKDRGELIYIPVWDFFGDIEFKNGEDTAGGDDRPDTSYMTVNALDGSVIDRSVGY